ncbi:DsbA family protein [Cellulomonas sp. URHB0016]
MTRPPRDCRAVHDQQAVDAHQRRASAARSGRVRAVRRSTVATVAGVAAVLALTSACDGSPDASEQPSGSASAAPAGGPENMLSDGAVFVGEAGTIAVRPTAALAEGAAPVATSTLRDGGLIDVVLYVDYRSPEAATFWSTNSAMLEDWLSGGHVTFEVHPVAVMDGAGATATPGEDATAGAGATAGDYSARAAGAFACVAATDPEHAYAVNAALLSAQPDLPAEGLTDEALVDLVAESGATGEDVASCIENGDWTDWVAQSTARAEESVPFDNVPALDVPMRLLIGGVPYPGKVDSGEQFFTFMAQTYNGIMAAAQQKALGDPGTPPTPAPGG